MVLAGIMTIRTCYMHQTHLFYALLVAAFFLIC